MEIKKGKLTYIAKGDVKGIHLDNNKEIWYNPTKECKDLVQHDLLQKNVELTMVDGKKNQFSDIKALLPEGNKGPVNSYDRNIQLQNAAKSLSVLYAGKEINVKEFAIMCQEFVEELYK